MKSNSHSGLRAGDFADELPQLVHGGALAQKVLAGFLVVPAEILVDLEDLGELLRLPERYLDLFIGERFDEIVKRSVLHALDRGFHAPKAGGHDGQRLLWARLEQLEQVGTVAIREADIEEDDVKVVLGQAILGGGNGRDRGHIIATAPQTVLEVFADNLIVFEDDHFFYGHSSGPRVAPIEIRYAVGLLHRPGRQMPGGQQAAPQEGLLVFTIQQQHLHEQNLY